jgi:hypothetical protein
VGLAENIEIHAVRFVAEIAERFVGVGGDDEQDGIGSGGTRLQNLKGVEDEVLAEAGNFDCRGGLLEVCEGALEELLVGEDREGGGSGRLEGAGLSLAAKPRGVWADALRSRRPKSATALRAFTCSRVWARI